MTTQLPAAIPKTIPAARRALDAMAVELDAAETYEAILTIKRKAKAFKLLCREVDEITIRASEVVVLAQHRIGQELTVVTSSKPGRFKKGDMPSRFRMVDLVGCRKRAYRYKQLGSHPKALVTAMIGKLKREGTDITSTGVLKLISEAQLKRRRQANYAASTKNGCTIADLNSLISQGKRFSTIYIDPPLELETSTERSRDRSPERHYDVWSVDKIKRLPIAALAAKSSTLLLWCVSHRLPDALDIIASWGFNYSTIAFNWIKTNRDGSVFTGMGSWTRGGSELCLLATRGTPKRLDYGVGQVIHAPIGQHSAKPAEVRHRIERLVAGPYLELFSRHVANGWTCWGNEIKRR